MCRLVLGMAMARYRPVVNQPCFLPVVPSEQLLPGTFEFALNHLSVPARCRWTDPTQGTKQNGAHPGRRVCLRL